MWVAFNYTLLFEYGHPSRILCNFIQNGKQPVSISRSPRKRRVFRKVISKKMLKLSDTQSECFCMHIECIYAWISCPLRIHACCINSYYLVLKRVQSNALYVLPLFYFCENVLLKERKSVLY